MADEKLEARDGSFRYTWPWMELFRGFQVAMDPKKLLLAAGGILVMAFGWWLLAEIFYHSRSEPPAWDSGKYGDNWHRFKEERQYWNLLYEAAGPDPAVTDANDLAQKPEEYDPIKTAYDKIPDATKTAIAEGRHASVPITVPTKGADDKPVTRTVYVEPKLYGTLRTWPWYEDRGPNPYLLVTGQQGQVGQHGEVRLAPWQRGEFLNWFLTRQVPVLLEPLVKFFRPVIYLLHPTIGFWNWLYFSLVLVWTFATWALFGGAITRMAAVQVARKDKIGLTEAVRFTLTRYLSFFSALLFPLVFVLVILLCQIVYGWFGMIPIFGDIIVYGVFLPLILVAGLVSAIILVGLIGWPMMYATISAEGSDSFDALSRSYSYVFQAFWHYLWYTIVALVYGAAVVFFVGLMGAMTVYLAKWGVSQTPGIKVTRREPSFLFVYAPTSFDWRTLLLTGGQTNEGQYLVQEGHIDQDAYTTYVDHEMTWYNQVGAVMVAVWLYLVFLLVVGFGYSYFWSASTIIYLLMRRKVDDTDLDEVYLEEDESEEAYTPSAPVAAVSPPAPAATNLTMVEAPALRPSATPPATPPKVETTPPTTGDGNPPPGDKV